jgi:hypothetical protein
MTNIFSHVDDETRKILSRNLELVEFNDGQIIVKQGRFLLLNYSNHRNITTFYGALFLMASVHCNTKMSRTLVALKINAVVHFIRKVECIKHTLLLDLKISLFV